MHLLDRLEENARSKILPMHMPGHKRNVSLLGDKLPYHLDVTELRDFDDLHDMNGVLLDIAKLASRLYGAGFAFPMINGTTGGILAAIRAAVFEGGDRPGGSVVMSRYSHRSVYNAAELCRLSPVYFSPETKCGLPGKAEPAAVLDALSRAADVRCVVITSPTYEGFVSDIEAISKITRERAVPLIVDAAHGAQFGLSGIFPKNAVRLGADIELVSLHKTLPALTQSSLALVREDGLVQKKTLERQLRVFETSSPSYVLLASIEKCLVQMRDEGETLLKEYGENLRSFYSNARELKHLKVLETDNDCGHDIGKIVITTNNSDITGNNLQTILREEHRIELEMAAPDYAVAMTSLCDTRASFERFGEALKKIDSYLQPSAKSKTGQYTLPKRVFSPFEAAQKSGSPLPIATARGRISLEYVWAYPPGIPVLAPGEIIDDAVIGRIKKLAKSGITPRSDYGLLPDIMCVKV